MHGQVSGLEHVLLPGVTVPPTFAYSNIAVAAAMPMSRGSRGFPELPAV
jgi:hypothetical protein